jgi:hypothetical protein
LEPEHEAARYNIALAHLALQNKSAALEQYAILKRGNASSAKALYKLIFSKWILSAKPQ